MASKKEKKPRKFFAVKENLRLHLKPEKQIIRSDGITDFIPAVMAKFEGGKFITDNDEVADLIKETESFKRGHVSELTDKNIEDAELAKEVAEEIKKRKAAKKGKVARGAIDSEVLAGRRKTPKKITIKEKTAVESAKTECDICGKEFDNDPTGKRLRAHKMWHRKVEKRAKTKRE